MIAIKFFIDFLVRYFSAGCVYGDFCNDFDTALSLSAASECWALMPGGLRPANRQTNYWPKLCRNIAILAGRLTFYIYTTTTLYEVSNVNANGVVLQLL